MSDKQTGGMRKKLKLSPWHDGSVKPAHVGVYQKEWPDDGDGIFYSFWNGKYWGCVSREPDVDTYMSEFQNGNWRGVLK